jgi:CRP-like cAMP-binding protein
MHFKRPKGRRALSSRRVTAPYLPWVRPKMTRRPTPEDGGPFAFVTPGSGGLKGPIGLVFGPNGDLFAGSFGVADLSSRELDTLASRLVRERFPTGAAVVEEGDPGDAFYLIDSGQAEVIVAGRRTEILTRGTYFGEIALLLNTPRTATVRALTPLDVFKFRRPDFEALVATTLHHVAGVLEEVGRERLVSRQGPNLVGRPGTA